MDTAKKIGISLILLGGATFWFLNKNRQQKTNQKSFQELKNEALMLLNALEVDNEQRKKLMYAINTKRKQLEKLQDPMKFLLANGLKI